MSDLSEDGGIAIVATQAGSGSGSSNRHQVRLYDVESRYGDSLERNETKRNWHCLQVVLAEKEPQSGREARKKAIMAGVDRYVLLFFHPTTFRK